MPKRGDTQSQTDDAAALRRPAKLPQQEMSVTEEAEYWNHKVRKSAHGMYYLRSNFPAELPPGLFLVHNQGAFCDSSLFGFRSWIQASRTNLVRCHCDYGGTLSIGGKPLTKAEVPKHYKVRTPRAS